MSQESLFEGIVRSIKKNYEIAILIIALSIFVSFLINRFSPSLYKSSTLVRILTSNNLSDKDIATEMNGVLSLKEVQEEIAQKCNLDKKYIKTGELAKFTNSDSGLFTLTIKYIDPQKLNDIGNEVVKTLANRFLLCTSDSQEFSSSVLKNKLDHLEKSITSLKKQKVTNSNKDVIKLRLVALEELYKKTLVEFEESKITKTTNTGRINIVRKNQIPPQAIGFTAIQRDCLAVFSGILLSIFLLYTPSPAKAEIVGISAEALATSLMAHVELNRTLNYEKNAKKSLPFIIEPAETILEVPPLVSQPLSLPCLVSEEEVLSLKYDERLVALNEPDSEILKPYKDLVANLQITLSESENKILIACSNKSGTGTTSVISNIAILLAQAGYSVLLIDANFRKPSIHRIFGLNNVSGLSNMLNGEKSYNVIQHSFVKNLNIISSGISPEDPEKELSSTNMVKLLDSLKSRMEIILIDTPALLEYPETALLAGHIGAVTFVNKEDEPEEDLKKSKSILDEVGAKVFGYVKI